MIITQEISQLCCCCLEYLHIRKIYYSEVIRILPVKSRSTCDEDVLIPQKIKSELFIICDVELLLVKFREYVERCLRLNHTYSRYIAECFVYILPLIIDPSSRQEQLICTLISAKAGLNYTLSRNI